VAYARECMGVGGAAEKKQRIFWCSENFLFFAFIFEFFHLTALSLEGSAYATAINSILNFKNHFSV
jgi:hypothetical protein